MWHQYFWSGGFWIFPFLMMLVMLVACVFMATRMRGVCWPADFQNRTKDEAPLDIAKRRYASGEITKEQFEALKKDLAA